MGDATAAKPIDTKSIQASSGERGCPRCGGAVFEAEKVVAGESVRFHKACFDCRCVSAVLMCQCNVGDRQVRLVSRDGEDRQYSTGSPHQSSEI